MLRRYVLLFPKSLPVSELSRGPWGELAEVQQKEATTSHPEQSIEAAPPIQYSLDR